MLQRILLDVGKTCSHFMTSVPEVKLVRDGEGRERVGFYFSYTEARGLDDFSTQLVSG